MLVVRPLDFRDLDQLRDIVPELPWGNSGSFHTNRKGLETIIAQSIESFSCETKKAGHQTYVFALEETESQQMIGFCKLAATNNGFPVYSYRLETIEQRSPKLQVDKSIQVLRLIEDSGPIALPSSLFIRSRYRAKGYDRLVLDGAYLYMGSFPQRFPDRIVNEYRGLYDTRGNSLFWKYIIQPFIRSVSYKGLLRLLRQGLEHEITRLLPSGPIYLPLLPKRARKIIGQVHPEAAPAFRLMQRHGFRNQSHISYSSGAPLLETQIRDITTIQQNQRAIVDKIVPNLIGQTYLVNVIKSDMSFCVCPGIVEENFDGTVNLPSALAQQLHIYAGDTVSFTKTRLRQSFIFS